MPRLPERACFKQVCCTFNGIPLAEISGVFQFDIQIPRYDPVAAAGNAVGKPCKCGSDQQEQAEDNGQDAGGQGRFVALLLFMFFPPIIFRSKGTEHLTGCPAAYAL